MTRPAAMWKQWRASLLCGDRCGGDRALPESISAGDADVIAAARAAYEAVDASIRGDVSNYDVLTAAEKALVLAQAADADALLAQVP